MGYIGIPWDLMGGQCKNMGKPAEIKAFAAVLFSIYGVWKYY